MNTNRFWRILIDTGVAHGNFNSMNQYLAYRYHVGCNPLIDESKSETLHFGNGSKKSQGTARSRLRLGALSITFNIYILRDATIPLSICIEEMDRRGFYFNNLVNRPIYTLTGHSISVVWDGAYSFIL